MSYRCLKLIRSVRTSYCYCHLSPVSLSGKPGTGKPEKTGGIRDRKPGQKARDENRGQTERFPRLSE